MERKQQGKRNLSGTYGGHYIYSRKKHDMVNSDPLEVSYAMQYNTKVEISIVVWNRQGDMSLSSSQPAVPIHSAYGTLYDTTSSFVFLSGQSDEKSTESESFSQTEAADTWPTTTYLIHIIPAVGHLLNTIPTIQYIRYVDHLRYGLNTSTSK